MVMFQIRTHFLRNVSKIQYRGRFRNATLTHVWCCNDLNSLIWQSRGQHFWFPNCWLFPPRLYFLGYGFYTVDQLLLLHVQLNITEDINKRCPKKMSLFNRAWKSFIFRSGPRRCRHVGRRQLTCVLPHVTSLHNTRNTFICVPSKRHVYVWIWLRVRCESAQRIYMSNMWMSYAGTGADEMWPQILQAVSNKGDEKVT